MTDNASLNRRAFLAASGTVALGTSALIGASPVKDPGGKRPMVLASGNGMKAVEKTMELLKAGMDPLDAAIAGVAIVEADPNDRTVGYGGIPNEDGVVELDAAVMHGPTHSGGAVASLRNIMHPAAVARLVMKRTDHCLLVGEGALKFAKMHGFPEENLLTEDSRKIWLHWKETNAQGDDRFPPDDDDLDPIVRQFFGIRKHGTIHCSALDTHGDLGCTTTTSGLFYKIPGRVGDSPILGAGLYLNNDVGSGGSTGRGEANLLNLSSFMMIESLRGGMDPKGAALEACRRVVATNKLPRLRTPDGRPNFNVSYYCLAKDGRYGGASIWQGGSFVIHDGDSARKIACVPLFDEKVPATAD